MSAIKQMRYSSFIKSKRLHRSYEHDNINALAYLLYKHFTSAIDRLGIYIKDNESGKVYKIVKEYTESMIGVDHPEQGYMGFLNFIEVDKMV